MIPKRQEQDARPILKFYIELLLSLLSNHPDCQHCTNCRLLRKAHENSHQRCKDDPFALLCQEDPADGSENSNAIDMVMQSMKLMKLFQPSCQNRGFERFYFMAWFAFVIIDLDVKC